MVGDLAKLFKGEVGKRITNMQWKPGSMLTGAMQQTMSQFMVKGISNLIDKIGRRPGGDK